MATIELYFLDKLLTSFSKRSIFSRLVTNVYMFHLNIRGGGGAPVSRHCDKCSIFGEYMI